MATAEQPHRLQAINQATLTPLVRQALGDEALAVTSWAHQPVYGGSGFFAHIYRFAGSAQAGEQVAPWSLILKISQAALGSPDPPSTWYWKREALVYQSGFLEQLAGGLVAPRCYAVHEPAEGEAWIWLEDLHDAVGPQWPLERYELAARHLGYFNGRYLAQQPAPTAAWLSHHCRLSERLARSRVDGVCAVGPARLHSSRLLASWRGCHPIFADAS
jgi:hypothetical protein